MNERIRELAEQAGYGRDRWNTTEQFEQFMEKFAELIVRECAERLLNDTKLTDIQTTRCVASIKEHFGVDTSC